MAGVSSRTRSSAAVDALGAYIVFAVDFPLLAELQGRRSSGRRSPGGFVAEVTRPCLSSAPYDSGEPLATARTEEGPYRAVPCTVHFQRLPSLARQETKVGVIACASTVPLIRGFTIVERKAADELSHFLRDARSPGPAPGEGSPVEAEALAVPADHGLGLDDDQHFLPARPKPVQCDPEGTIKGREPRPGSRLGVGGELLAQGKLDDRLLPASSEEG